MSDATKYEPVTFENSLGEIISNDPVFHAQRTLEAYGVDNDSRVPAVHREKGPADDAEFDDNPYAYMDQKALKALAIERNISLKGLKTLGEVRAAFAAADEVEEANSGTGDDQGNQD